MPKITVVKCQCDRCPRTWYEDPKESAPTARASVQFEPSDGSPVVERVFDVLCPTCEKAVLNYVASILKEKVKEEGDERSPSSSED